MKSKPALSDRIEPGETFYAPPFVLTDARVTDVHDDPKIPIEISHEVSTAAWGFEAVEPHDGTEWYAVVAPDVSPNHEAVVYLFWVVDGETAGHHQVYAKGIVTGE